METRFSETAERIYQLSTFVGAPMASTSLIDADEPLLFRSAMRRAIACVVAHRCFGDLLVGQDAAASGDHCVSGGT